MAFITEERWIHILPARTEEDSMRDYISCVNRIRIPETFDINVPLFIKVIADIYHGNLLDVNEIREQLGQAIYEKADGIEDEELSPIRIDKYIQLLSEALLSCRKYARRYDRCMEMEHSGVSPDEIEKCYEVADKTRPPVFIWWLY